MKGLNRVNMQSVLKELDQLKKESMVANQVTGGIISINEDGTLSVRVNINKGKRSSVRHFKADDITKAFKQIKDIAEDATLIVDDMSIAHDEMYLPTGFILASGKEKVKRLSYLADQEAITYLKEYIELFVDFFEIETDNDSSLTYYILAKPVLVDLLANYNQLPLETLVERYKDQRFFDTKSKGTITNEK